MQKFGFTDSAFGWAFALNACGLIAGSQLNQIALKRYSSQSIVRFTSICLVMTTLTSLTYMARTARAVNYALSEMKKGNF